MNRPVVTAFGPVRNPAGNVVPLHRAVVTDRPVDHYDAFAEPSECVEDMVGGPAEFFFGLVDAALDFIADPRFIAGFYVGTMFVCAAAFVVAF